MTKANYGAYGSLTLYSAHATVTILLLILVLLTEYLCLLFTVLLFVSAALLVLIPLVLSMAYGQSRTRVVPEIVKMGRIGSKDRVLDIGTGRGFPAIEIAKEVPSCRVVGVDVWDSPAKGQIHKGFIVGNSKENAERNAVLEGVQDRVEFKQCDARETPFEPASFDVVVSFTSLHQMVYFGRDGDRVLKEIHRVLKPGGRLVDVDAMIGRRIVEKIGQLGFKEIELRELMRFPLSLKMLSATKSLQ